MRNVKLTDEIYIYLNNRGTFDLLKIQTNYTVADTKTRLLTKKTPQKLLDQIKFL